ncbi:glycoside hydrolase family 2 protein [Paenibacillus mendelii]|uniref:beta-mannosidase n=1 Tax=Paenibacillus mendelii TaxID=206163 RepID=A0ABM9M5F2_9BACL|nr:sugar-binding domain-containing protein [Paenibacillus mendelii]MCQ6561354.1 hypothetical protein [Paenibacillus mendelii]
MIQMTLNGEDWTLTGYYRNQWRSKLSMELGRQILPNIPEVKATVPGAVQMDLRSAGWLGDYNQGLESLNEEWVYNRDWFFEKRMFIPSEWVQDRCELILEGLDFKGEIYLNGQKITEFEGMFQPLSLDVTEIIKENEENCLQIVFCAGPEVDGQVGYSHLITKLKSRFNYAWDWCPRITPVGIWRDVYLRTFREVKILDFYPETSLNDEFNIGEVHYHAEVEVYTPGEYTFVCHLKDDTGENRFHKKVKMFLPGGKRKVGWKGIVGSVQLWWPNGLGDQPLYIASLEIMNESGLTCDDSQKQVGFRTIEFVQNPGAPSDSLAYSCIVNGHTIFLKGINWVPITPYYGAVTTEQYRETLGRFKMMNVNLIRVWGGAIIEKEEFYRYCDQQGLLVWQEFLQSSSGLTNLPPVIPELLKDLETVSRIAIKEKRSHPSLAIWCGGNELMWDGFIPVDERHINIGMLQKIVRELDPSRYFLPSSASGPKFLASEEDFGKGLHHDVHGPWLYLGENTHYRFYNNDDSLLRSETGTPGVSRAEILRSFAGQHEVWPPTSDNPLWVHRGSWWIPWNEISQLFGPWDLERDETEVFAQCSRYAQMESLRYGVEATRRREPTSSGFIVWMGNEPFANYANTSLLEYDGIPKPAYYAMKSAFADCHVSLKYDRIAYQAGETFSGEAFVHLESNFLNKANIKGMNLQIEIIDMFGSVKKRIDYPITDRGYVGSVNWEIENCGHSLFNLRLVLWNQDQRLACNDYLFTINADFPFKPLRDLPLSNVQISQGALENTMTFTNDSPITAVGVMIREKDASMPLHLERNYLIIHPGEEVTLRSLGGEYALKNIIIEGLNV